jgi:predicted phage tail component-like protein
LQGFTFDGVHSDSLGITVTHIELPTPEIREYEEEIPGVSGVYDFGTEFGKRMIEIECMVVAFSGAELNTKLRAITKLFNPINGAKKLILDRDLNVAYYAKSAAPITLPRIGSMSEFTLQLKCTDPFAHQDSTGTSPGQYDTGLKYDSGLRYMNETSFNITVSPTKFILGNVGAIPTRPVFTFTGSGTNPKISIGSDYIQYNGTLDNQAITFDLETYRVLLDGVNVLKNTTGSIDKLELAVGDTEVTFTCTSPSGTLKAAYDYLHI